MKTLICIKFIIFALLILVSHKIKAQQFEPRYYDIGSPTLTEIWVDPVNGNDNNNGSMRSQALKTLTAAWGILPRTFLTTGYKIKLTAGTYTYRDQSTNNIVGIYLDERHGTYNFPIIIESVDGLSKAIIFSAIDFRDVSYVYLIGLDFRTDPTSDGGGNTLHFAAGDHILIRNCKINGFDGNIRKPQETLKVNQVSYIYVEDCDISGAFWFSLDYVGVQYGHIQGCKIHDASEDCLLLKGGTTQIRVEGCSIYNADRFGFSAGQGAGFDFLVNPWLHYEAYDLKFINNVVYNTQYAGIAVLGGYNMLIAYNTLYKIGIDKNGDRTLMTFNLGQRGCDGAEPDTCNAHHLAGGWSPGPWSNPPIENGTEYDCIPNRNIFVFNNIFYNPYPDSTIGNHIEVRGPYDGTDLSSTFLQSCNLPNPVLSDDNLRIRGNIIWNGSTDKSLGIDEGTGCQNSNVNCNQGQLLQDNSFNTIEPELVAPINADFHPNERWNISNLKTFSIPNFPGNDIPLRPIIPSGNLINSITRDFDNKTRLSLNPPGAFSSSARTRVDSEHQLKNREISEIVLSQNYPNPFNPATNIEFRITEGSLVSIKVYDILGREISTLSNKRLNPGEYKIVFDGNKFPNGVYFYRLITPNFIQTKKMEILK
jgi:hypothetical protein